MAAHPRYRRTSNELTPPQQHGRRSARPSRAPRARLIGGASAAGLAAAVAVVVAGQALAAPSSAFAFPSRAEATAVRIALTPAPGVTPRAIVLRNRCVVDATPAWPGSWTPSAASTPDASDPSETTEPTSAATSEASTPSPEQTSPEAEESSAAPSPSADEPSSTPTASEESPSTDPVPILPGLRSLLLQPFAVASPWNTPIGGGATYSGAGSALTDSLQRNARGSYINSTAYSVPITVASSSDPVQRVSVSGPAGAAHRMPTDAKIAQGTDGTMVVIDGSKAYEYWQARRDGSGHYSASYGTVVDLTGTGVSGGVRASGFSITAGLIRKDETTSIDHALVVALSGDQLRSGSVWPATLQDNDAASSYRGAVPMGSLIAIPDDVDVNALGLSTEGRALARALQRYGAYVGDRSSQLTLYAEPETASPALERMRADLRSKLAPLLRVVTNSSRTSVGGPGARLAPLAAALKGD